MAFQGWVYSEGKRGLYPTTLAWVYKLSVHFCARWAPLVGCLNREIYEGLRAIGAPPERLWLAPNCVDFELWRTEKDGAHRREERQVLFVGRFSKEKGLRYLLEAAPALLERLPQVRLRVVGGEESDNRTMGELARQLGVSDRVDFAGVAPRESLPEVYAAADVLAVPSLAEGHPLAPIECLACGTPVVASDIPGLNETIEEGRNGLLVPARDPAALADALGRVLGDPDLLDRLSRSARPSVERFAWEPRVRDFVQHIARLRGGT
jgi:glycosyltransferase involved in cell wall biosynthesis